MERIAIVIENSEEYIYLLLKIWKNNDCAVLINRNLPIDTILRMLKWCDCKKCYVSKKMYSEIKKQEYKQEVLWMMVEDDRKRLFCLTQDMYQLISLNNLDAEALILFSSGTTGICKGVVHTQRSILANAMAIISYLNLGLNDKIYIMRDLSYSSTIVGEILVCLLSQTQAVVSRGSVSMRCHLATITQYKVSKMIVNPTLLRMFIEVVKNNRVYDLSFLKEIYTCGAPASAELLREAKRVMPAIMIYNMYGLTEAGPRVTGERVETLSGAVGEVIDGVTVKILTEQPSDEYGTIWIRTPSIMKGYVQGDNSCIHGEWLETNDIGYMDGERLFVVGRKDNMIIHNAHNIYPEAIELLIQSFPDIVDVLIRVSNEEKTQILTCYYTTIDGQELPNSKILDVVQKCRLVLNPNEIPQKFIHVLQFQKTATGKIKRKQAII